MSHKNSRRSGAAGGSSGCDKYKICDELDVISNTTVNSESVECGAYRVQVAGAAARLFANMIADSEHDEGRVLSGSTTPRKYCCKEQVCDRRQCQGGRTARKRSHEFESIDLGCRGGKATLMRSQTLDF